MGLFDKKECSICKGKVGIMGRKLTDGQLCTDCWVAISELLTERDANFDDQFAFKKISLQVALDAKRYFFENPVQKKMTKGLDTYLSVLAVDEESQMLEVKGKRGVYRFPMKDIDNILYDCVDDTKENKLKMRFVFSSKTVPWIEGYVLDGVFKNDAFFRSGAKKKMEEDATCFMMRTHIEMLKPKEFLKRIK